MVLPLLSPAPDILFIIDRSIVFSPAFPFLSFIYCQLFTVPPEECFPSGQCCKQRRDHSQDQNTGNDACRYSLCLCTSEIHFLLRPPKWIECRSAPTSQMLRIRVCAFSTHVPNASHSGLCIQHPRPKCFAFGTMADRGASRLVRPGKRITSCPVSKLPVQLVILFPGCWSLM